MLWAWLTVAKSLSARVRLLVIAALLVMSVFVDSVYYIMSALTDALFIAAASWVGWPLIRTLLAQKPQV